MFSALIAKKRVQSAVRMRFKNATQERPHFCIAFILSVS